MGDRTFEADLERGFAQTPAFHDADLFALRVTEALDRGWAVRRLLIGALGVAGGLIGGAQFLRYGLIAQVASVETTSRLLVEDVTRLPAARAISSLLNSGATMDSEVLWMSGALAVLAFGLFVTRAIREF